MGGARLLRRRLGAHPVAVAAITVSVLASLVVVTALQLLSARITDAGVRSALDVPPADRSVVVTGSLRPGELGPTDAAVRAALAPLRGAAVTRVATTTSRGIAGRAASDRAALADVDGLRAASELTAGRWPEPLATSSERRPRVEVALPEAAARALSVAPGDDLALTDLVDADGPRLSAEVVGTFRPRNAEDGLWSDLPLALDGVVPSDFTTYGPLVVAPGTFDGPLVGTSTVTWRAVPDLAAVRAGDLAGARARADDVLTRLRTVTGLPTVEGVQASARPATVPLRSPRVASDLPALVDSAAVVGDRVRVSLLTPAVLLVLLGSVALVGAAALLATLRDAETRLLRVRGASTRRLAGLAVGDALVVALVGVLGAVLGAPVVTRLVAGSGPWWSPAVLRDATLWGALLPLALLAVTVTVATTLWVGRSREDARSRRAGLRLAAGSGLDVVLVVLGALAVVQLRRYDAVGQRAVDPVTTLAPALVVAGLSVLALRLLPLLARLVARWGARRPGLDAAWGGWQFARRAATQGGTLLLVLLAVAMGTIALGHSATVGRAVADQSAFDTGAPLRVVQQVGGPTSGSTGALVDRAAGGADRVTPVWRTSVDLGSVEGVTVLGMDARAATRVLDPRPDTLDAPWSDVTGRLLAGRDLGDGLALPGSPREVTVTAQVLATGSSSALGPEGFAASLAVRDARGLVTSVPLGSVGSDRRTLTADLSRLGLLAPLSVVGVSVPLPDFVSFFVPEPTFDLVVTAVAADGTDVPLGRVLGPHSDRSGLWLAARAGRTEVVPAVVTREVADALGAGRGGRVTLPLGLRELPVEVVAVVDSLPTAEQPGRGILLDLPTVEAAPDRVGGGSDVRSRLVLDPQEWWAAPADPARAAAAVRAGLPYGTTLEVEDEAVAERLRDPVNAGMRSAMLLVTLASVLLAGVGFAASTAALGRARRHENAVLLALGSPPGRIRAVLVLERVLVVVVTVAVGLVLGVLAAVTVVPLLVGGDGHPQVPPVRVELPAGLLAGYVLLLVLALSVVGAFVLRSTSRDLAGELRRGESP
ncbi:FtsX-like permease family protein [Arthrobacter sp. NEB 688]|uniref:FtsX-like permease family protein n=1 Tax=Arthrobacter sp. NEB 688 TaxID=904039 RepID=UPI0015674A2A|nr:FtsX-like permease family protein [Arthrobacter sp. NEB 688]QKE85379.1 hypothetical protein HL663_16515 [Arthrobacter sp. NEB 688]